MAEQQLPIPASWLKLPASTPAQEPSSQPESGGLTLAHKSHDGVKHISVSGPDGLHIEVPRFVSCRLTPGLDSALSCKHSHIHKQAVLSKAPRVCGCLTQGC